MGVQYRKRVRLPKLGPVEPFLNLSLSGLSPSLRIGRFTISRRGVSVRGPKGWSWRS